MRVPLPGSILHLYHPLRLPPLDLVERPRRGEVQTSPPSAGASDSSAGPGFDHHHVGSQPRPGRHVRGGGARARCIGTAAAHKSVETKIEIVETQPKRTEVSLQTGHRQGGPLRGAFDVWVVPFAARRGSVAEHGVASRRGCWESKVLLLLM